MLQNEDNNTTHDNKSTATAIATEASCHQDKPVEVSTIHNRWKAIVYSPPKIVHRVHEPRAKALNTDVVESSKEQEDDTTILNYVYFSKISELAARAEVSNCRQFGSPNSKKSKTVAKNTKRCLSTTSSIDSSSDEDSMVVDEDELPIDELVYSISK
jgi:hypothetical protein